MEIRFENKVAFITGAAGGIGYAAARMFAEAGASVVMADLDSRVTDRAKELEAELAKSTLVLLSAPANEQNNQV
jgi:NAD(P)-dependent dehydrogenase (short-subunit alcohol dehydrogenase family)